jgi:hypothetical protein
MTDRTIESGDASGSPLQDAATDESVIELATVIRRLRAQRARHADPEAIGLLDEAIAISCEMLVAALSIEYLSDAPIEAMILAGIIVDTPPAPGLAADAPGC